MIAYSVAGASKRDFVVLDLVLIGVLPFLVGLAALARSRMLIGVVSGICGVLVLLYLPLALGNLPATLPPGGHPR